MYKISYLCKFTREQLSLQFISAFFSKYVLQTSLLNLLRVLIKQFSQLFVWIRSMCYNIVLYNHFLILQQLHLECRCEIFEMYTRFEETFFRALPTDLKNTLWQFMNSKYATQECLSVTCFYRTFINSAISSKMLLRVTETSLSELPRHLF